MTSPDGAVAPTLTIAQTARLAARYGLSTKDIEITALENSIIPARYARNRNTFSCEDQIRLLKSQVSVIGLGGLGGALVEVLARAGVGGLNLVDGDVFEDHNLNRQLLSSHEHLGIAKARAARDRIERINTSVNVRLFDFDMTTGNAARLLQGSQVAIDCLDTIDARFTLESAARQAALPMVSAAVAGCGGHVTTIFPGDQGLASIYGGPGRVPDSVGVETALGCLPQAVVFAAAVEANEVMQIILENTQSLLRNRLLIFDLSQNLFEVLELG